VVAHMKALSSGGRHAAATQKRRCLRVGDPRVAVWADGEPQQQASRAAADCG
jgi:hypothetical protein